MAPPVGYCAVQGLSPLQHEQVNLHGRYSFLLPDQLRAGELRPLLTGDGG